MPIARQQTESDHANAEPLQLRFPRLLLLVGFSVFYFADVCLRASQKYFWFDELGTVYQCRLSLRDLWSALRAGFDFNPPLLYLLTKLANSLFGEGLVVTRLPEIVGFWIFSLCLFHVVSKRAGLLPGFCVMLLPMFTGAFYYAYDARPHGVVLAFCGVALVGWQASLQVRHQKAGLLVFALAFFAALMTHCYAITLTAPFGVTELVKSVRDKRIAYHRWAALLLPALLAVVVYIPLLSAYHTTIGPTIFLDYSPLRWSQISNFYLFLLSPCILIVLLIVLLLALKGIQPVPSSQLMNMDSAATLPLEITLAFALLALPVIGLLLALLLRSPFYSRYFLSALAGFCMIVGLGVGLGRRATWASAILAVALTFSLLADFSSLLWHGAHGWAEHLAEPSSGFAENMSLHGPLANYQMVLLAAKKGERIVVLWPMDFLYLVNYAPEIRSQLYYVGWSNQDPIFQILNRMQQYVPFAYNALTAKQFYTSRADFMVLGMTCDLGQLPVTTRNTLTQRSLEFANNRYLAEVAIK